jgi:hypothetical protein
VAVSAIVAVEARFKVSIVAELQRAAPALAVVQAVEALVEAARGAVAVVGVGVEVADAADSGESVERRGVSDEPSLS